MDIGHQRHVASRGQQARFDVFQVGRIDAGLGRDPDDLTTGLHQTQRFLHAGLGIAGIAGEHALHAHRIVPADGDFAYCDDTGFPPLIMIQVGAVAEHRGIVHRGS